MGPLKLPQWTWRLTLTVLLTWFECFITPHSSSVFLDVHYWIFGRFYIWWCAGRRWWCTGYRWTQSGWPTLWRGRLAVWVRMGCRIHEIMYFLKFLLTSCGWFITIIIFECVLLWPVMNHMSHGATPTSYRIVMVVFLKQWLVYAVDKLDLSDIIAIIRLTECFPTGILSNHFSFCFECGFGLGRNAEYCRFALFKYREIDSQDISHF